MKLGLVAPPPLSDAVPSDAPPLPQPEAELSGPQTENDTLPVGLPPVALPVTVTESAVEPASWIELSPGVEIVALSAWVTVKHSPAEPSLEAK